MDVRNSNSNKRLAQLFLELTEGAEKTKDGIEVISSIFT